MITMPQRKIIKQTAVSLVQKEISFEDKAMITTNKGNSLGTDEM